MSLAWSEKRVSNSNELRDVDMYIYVDPAGLIGRFIGRSLRFSVGKFSYVVERQNNQLKRVEVDADSIRPQCEVYHPSRFERLPLHYSEKERLLKRTRNFVLDVPRYPHITYKVEEETAQTMSGTLQLKGEAHPVQCTKAIEGTELVVRCPVNMSTFHILPFKWGYGLFSEADTVFIETRVPAKVLKL